jgi:hypothetical protein
VLYDYGMGGVWTYIRARTANEINAKFLDISVYDAPPEWMTEALRQTIEGWGIFDVETVETEKPAFACLLRGGHQG